MLEQMIGVYVTSRHEVKFPKKNMLDTNQHLASIQLEVGDINLSEVGRYPGKHSKEENLFDKGSTSFVEELQR